MRSSVYWRTRTTRYSLYEWSAFGAMRLTAELEALSDGEALKRARVMLPTGSGELRQGARTVCRFGRAAGFMLQG